MTNRATIYNNVPWPEDDSYLRSPDSMLGPGLAPHMTWPQSGFKYPGSVPGVLGPSRGFQSMPRGPQVRTTEFVARRMPTFVPAPVPGMAGFGGFGALGFVKSDAEVASYRHGLVYAAAAKAINASSYGKTKLVDNGTPDILRGKAASLYSLIGRAKLKNLTVGAFLGLLSSVSTAGKPLLCLAVGASNSVCNDTAYMRQVKEQAIDDIVFARQYNSGPFRSRTFGLLDKLKAEGLVLRDNGVLAPGQKMMGEIVAWANAGASSASGASTSAAAGAAAAAAAAVASGKVTGKRPTTSGGSGGGSGSGTSRPTVQQGSSKTAEVTEIQQKLAALGYPVSVDGDFGPATKAAVIQFQRDHGLAADGAVGTNTWAALDSATSAAVSASLTTGGGAAGGGIYDPNTGTTYDPATGDVTYGPPLPSDYDAYGNPLPKAGGGMGMLLVGALAVGGLIWYATQEGGGAGGGGGGGRGRRRASAASEE